MEFKKPSIPLRSLSQLFALPPCHNKSGLGMYSTHIYYYFFVWDTLQAYNSVYCTMDADAAPLHIAMYPWFAMGHLTPFLHLANKLAKRGHKISFFIPRRTQAKLEDLNLHPNLITFVPINVPHVEGLPYDAETTSDVPSSLFPLIATANYFHEIPILSLLSHLHPLDTPPLPPF